MRGSLRTIALTATPAAAVATLALGLRIGARSELHAAVVFTAPPSMEARGLAWQILVVREEHGVRDTLAGVHLTVQAEGVGTTSEWRGTTNDDGVAEAWLDLPGAKPGDTIGLRVFGEGEPASLASGDVRVDAQREDAWRARASATPSRVAGPVVIDVATLGGALVPGFATDVWVSASSSFDGSRGAPAWGGRTRIDAEPEPGLTFEQNSVVVCPAGYAHFRATAMGHVLGARFTAHAPSGQTGEWFGALAVAGGASHVEIAPYVDATVPVTVTVTNPTPRPVGYVEIDDALGRAWGRTLTFVPDGHGYGRATFALEPMLPGLHWFVTASEPRGAETLAGAAIARPFFVGPPPSPSAACESEARLAHKVSTGFPRTMALEGMTAARARAEAGRKRGAKLAAIGIAAAAVLEALLILAGARRSQSDLLAMERELDADAAASTGDEPRRATRLGSRGAALRVAIGMALAMLGFALLASLVAYRVG